MNTKSILITVAIAAGVGAVAYHIAKRNKVVVQPAPSGGTNTGANGTGGTGGSWGSTAQDWLGRLGDWMQ